MAKMYDTNSAPYMLLSATLVACILFFGIMLWQGGAVKPADEGAPIYAPGFAVQADVVQVVRIVPLAGTALRSPTTDMDNTRAHPAY